MVGMINLFLYPII